jgi:hypothetical protein
VCVCVRACVCAEGEVEAKGAISPSRQMMDG